MPRSKSKTKLIEEFADAALQFIAKNPPDGFNTAYFTILVISGRLDEATEYLKNFKGEQP